MTPDDLMALVERVRVAARAADAAKAVWQEARESEDAATRAMTAAQSALVEERHAFFVAVFGDDA